MNVPMSFRRVLIRSLFTQPFKCISSPRNVNSQVNLSLYRCLMISGTLRCEDVAEEQPKEKKIYPEGKNKHAIVPVDPLESIKYMESEAYREMYGNDPIWTKYRRNFKGNKAPKPRKTCIRAGALRTGSACPICRDDYIIVDYRNIKLLQQFIEPLTGEVMAASKTEICMKQHRRLVLEVWKAQDHGYLMKHFPLRVYNYDYYENLLDEKLLQLTKDPDRQKVLKERQIERRNKHLKKMLHRHS